MQLTQLGLLCHLSLVDDVAQDLLLLQQLVLVQRLLLAEVVVVLLLVLLQLVQCPLQRPVRRRCPVSMWCTPTSKCALTVWMVYTLGEPSVVYHIFKLIRHLPLSWTETGL